MLLPYLLINYGILVAILIIEEKEVSQVIRERLYNNYQIIIFIKRRGLKMYRKDLITRSFRKRKQEQAGIQYPLATLYSEVDRLFDGLFSGFNGSSVLPFRGERPIEFSPKVNVSENDREIEVTVEIPGVDQSNVEITLNDNVLTIKGEKKEEKEIKDRDRCHVERSYGPFKRSLYVPYEIESDKVGASFIKGILKVILPKSEKPQGSVRKIEVKSE